MTYPKTLALLTLMILTYVTLEANASLQAMAAFAPRPNLSTKFTEPCDNRLPSAAPCFTPSSESGDDKLMVKEEKTASDRLFFQLVPFN